MTEIDFYTHADDRVQVAARLCAKAYGLGMRARVLTVDAAMTARLDQLLWTMSATGFLPHCRLSSTLAAQTPIIVDEALEHSGPADLLINLNTGQPGFFRRFTRLAEIVTGEPDDVSAGRLKWQYYRQQGYTLRVHNLAEG
ncbi:MAG: DNA polymerase III subunit chi [Betaproteobacteria bacterium]